jgi:hypothetical protein
VQPTTQVSVTANEGGTTVDLVAVIVCVTEGRPRVMTVGQGEALPSGPFELGHRSLQSSLRARVERQTGHRLGYTEQLYTFADSDRTREAGDQHAISISYLGLTRKDSASDQLEGGWRNWYRSLPGLRRQQQEEGGDREIRFALTASCRPCKASPQAPQT